MFFNCKTLETTSLTAKRLETPSFGGFSTAKRLENPSVWPFEFFIQDTASKRLKDPEIARIEDNVGGPRGSDGGRIERFFFFFNFLRGRRESKKEVKNHKKKNSSRIWKAIGKDLFATYQRLFAGGTNHCGD